MGVSFSSLQRRHLPLSAACHPPTRLTSAPPTLLPAVVVSFPRVDDPSTAFLAWTTTPWTLPSNLALCVHPELTYVTVRDVKTGAKYIMAESRVVQVRGCAAATESWHRSDGATAGSSSFITVTLAVRRCRSVKSDA